MIKIIKYFLIYEFIIFCLLQIFINDVKQNNLNDTISSKNKNENLAVSNLQINASKIQNDIPQDIIPIEVYYFYSLTIEERNLIENIVCGEAGNQPYEGKVAVANCILNACLLENKRPKEIQAMYGYAGYKSLEEFESECLSAYGNINLADEVRQAVSQVFDDGEIINNEILWFYAPKYSSGTWHQTQRFVVEVGSHRFYSPWD